MFLTRVTFLRFASRHSEKQEHRPSTAVLVERGVVFCLLGHIFLESFPPGTWERGLNQQPHLRYQAHLTMSICSPSRDKKQLGGCDAWNLWCPMLHQCLTHPGWGPLERKGNMRHSEWLDHLRSQWFCPHTLGRYPKLPQTPKNERNFFINSGWKTSGVFSRGMWVGS